ncbi:CHAD domain-containing protein [Chromobacterium vaccinii]|uniref:CHAD domain-containing protein n=1 Tax=Chromobacterium TaxID=535 RepID=UPI0013054196|nr:CHAD domain-containing protein [Chromobacterium sp. ATCC 53434]
MAPLRACRRAVLACLRHLLANVPGVLQGGNPEYLHQARVALRRLRAVCKAFAPLTGGGRWACLMEEARWLAGLLGEARDLDVLLTETLPGLATGSPAADIRMLKRSLRTRRDAAQDAVEAALLSDRFHRWLCQLLACLNRPSSAWKGARRPLPVLAATALDRLGRAAAWPHGEFADAERLHRLRRRAKQLRYAAECFSGLYRNKAVLDYLRGLQDLQWRLGVFNDRETARALLARCASDDPRTAEAARRVSARLERAGSKAERGLAGAIARAASARPFW